MKRISIMLTVLMAATVVLAQQTESVELLLSIYNQTKWQAKETTVTLNGEEEEQLAYELQGWQTNKGMVRQGAVYYVPSALDDRIILVMKDAISGYAKLPALIDNKTDKQLIIHVQGRVVLNCQGTAIRSVGGVSIYGQETEDGAEPSSTLNLQGGLRGHAALATGGDVYLQNLKLEMGNNSAPYGFLCNNTEGKEERILEMNHVTGQVNAKKAAVAGFQKIAGSMGTSVKGIEPNWTLEDKEDSDSIYTSVDQKPQFGDSITAWNSYLQMNMRYPHIAEENGIQGHVIVNFIVEPDGTVSNTKILRGVNTALDEEALRLIQGSSGQWHPGIIDGRPVRVSITLPVNFRLLQKQ